MTGRYITYAKIIPVDIDKMLSELRTEHAAISETILMLERLAAGRGKRRGRPPAWIAGTKRRGRPPGSKNKPRPESA